MNRKKRNHKGIFFMITGVLLVAAAFCLAGYNLLDEKRADESAAKVADRMQEVIKATQTEEPVEKQPAYLLNPEMEMPVEVIDEREYIGVLEIPSYGLELPVISEWSYPALKISPCRYEGSAYKENLIIAAHNYVSHFSCLKNLQVGETVSFTDVDGNVFRYEVVVCETLLPTAVEEMKSEEWDLTLFTCTTGGQYRVTVRCEQIDENRNYSAMKATDRLLAGYSLRKQLLSEA